MGLVALTLATGMAVTRPARATVDGSWADLMISGRSGHTAVYDPVRDRMLVFGGENSYYTTGVNYFNELWALSLSGAPMWTRPPISSPMSGRYGHSAIYDPVRDRMIVFGGSDPTHSLNEVWALSLSEPPTWTQLTPIGTSPSPRRGHTAIYDPVRDRMLVFGGWDDVNDTWVNDNDVWALSLAGTPTWTRLPYSGTAPCARGYHSAIYDPVRDRMVIFGGLGCNPQFPYLGDVWALSLSDPPTWVELTPAGSAGTRYDHTAIYDPVNDRMVVFAGQYTGPPAQVNSVFSLSLADPPAWTQLAPSGTLPSPRQNHAAIYDPVLRRMVVFSGYSYNDQAYPNDALGLSLDGPPAWTALASPGGPPLPRAGHTAIYDPVRDRMIVQGGTRPGDGWELSLGEPPSWSALAGAGGPIGASAIYDPVRDRVLQFGGVTHSLSGLTTTYYNDVWALTLTDPPATMKLTTIGTPPSPRAGHSAIYDPLHDRMIVFGGDSQAGFLNDVWALSLADPPRWTQLAPSGGPPSPRSGQTAIFDPPRHRMVVFGGNRTNEVWSLLLTSLGLWTQLFPVGTGPTRRELCSAIDDPIRDRMVIFGGYDGYTEFDEVWALMLSNPPSPPTWTALTHAGVSPAGRSSHTAIYDPVRDQMVVFGGDPAPFNDVWALRFADQVVPALPSLVSAQVQDGRVELDWFAAGGAGFEATAYRRTESTDWRSLGSIRADGAGHLRFEDAAASPGTRYAYRLGYPDLAGEAFTPETWVAVTGPQLALEGLRPNPAVGAVRVSFTLPSATAARLELLDVSGRIVLSREVGSLGVGSHVIDLGSAAETRSGMYWLRLTQDGRTLVARGVVLP